MKFKRRKIKRGRVEIIPMIDTIVILLIFYMTFSRFAEANRANIQLPSSSAGEEQKQKSGQVIINMFSAKNLTIGGVNYKMEDLPGILQGLKAKDPTTYANMSIILRGSYNMTYEDLSQFMNACARAKVVDVSFTTTERR